MIVVSLCVLASVGAAPATAAPRSGAAVALEAQIGDLDAQLDRAVTEYGAAARRLGELQADVRETRGRLREARFELLVAKATLRTRLVAMYKERPVDLLDVVVGSASFDELLGKLALMRRLSAADARLIASTERLERRLAVEQKTLTASVVRLKSSVMVAARERARLETLLVQRRALLADLRREAAAKAKAKARPSPKPPADTERTFTGQGAWWPVIKAAASANGIDARGLYRLMLVESGGVATAANGRYLGLFQYGRSTWRGSWNPWRNASIFDGAAQIRASAHAIHLGYGPTFWPNTFGYAFSG